MKDAFIRASKECTEQQDINPSKVLRPIGTTFQELFPLFQELILTNFDGLRNRFSRWDSQLLLSMLSIPLHMRTSEDFLKRFLHSEEQAQNMSSSMVHGHSIHLCEEP